MSTPGQSCLPHLHKHTTYASSNILESILPSHSNCHFNTKPRQPGIMLATVNPLAYWAIPKDYPIWLVPPTPTCWSPIDTHLYLQSSLPIGVKFPFLALLKPLPVNPTPRLLRSRSKIGFLKTTTRHLPQMVQHAV